MEYLVWDRTGVPEQDEPAQVYCELDENRMEQRRVECYPSGLMFSYGAEQSMSHLLAQEPFPTDLNSLEFSGPGTARPISVALFSEMWVQSQSQPMGFVGMEMF